MFLILFLKDGDIKLSELNSISLPGSYAAYLKAYGIYVVDVSKCTKNINTSKENLGDYEIMLVECSQLYNSASNVTTYARYLLGMTIPMLGNLLSIKYSIGSYTVEQMFPQYYGIQYSDVEEYDFNTFKPWLYNYLARYRQSIISNIDGLFKNSKSDSNICNDLINKYSTFKNTSKIEGDIHAINI